jgi:zinc transport system permease protein
MGFWEALANPDIAFLRHAFLASLLGSIAFGVVGSFVVVRRISYIAGAIAHCVLGGIGAALYLQTVKGWSWCDPMLGAIVAALLAAVVIGLVSLRVREREDTVIGALWSVGMAVGLIFLAKTPGYVDPMNYLFGNILLLRGRDLLIVGLLDALVVGMVVVYYRKFQAVCFDEEYARLRGLRADGLYLLLLCLTALTVVLMVRVVGIVLVIALLTLPAAVASLFARRLWQMMLLAIVLGAGVNGLGVGLSFQTDLPTGPTIIIVAALVYLLGLVLNRCRRSRLISK